MLQETEQPKSALSAFTSPSIDPIRRSMDVAFWNAVANDPDVRPWIGGEGPVDLTDVVLSPANFCLANAHGGFLCINHGAGAYSVHSLFRPEGRDGTADMVRAGQDFMFTRTDCSLLWTQLPDNNKPAAHLGTVAGFQPWFRRETDPMMGPSLIGRLGIDEWIVGPNATHLSDVGEDFHGLLESAKAASGSALPVHADDEAHNRYVGAAVSMCRRGQPAKGVFVYNSWAPAAGYAPITLVSALPPIVDVVDGVVGLSATGKLEVLLCR